MTRVTGVTIAMNIFIQILGIKRLRGYQGYGVTIAMNFFLQIFSIKRLQGYQGYQGYGGYNCHEVFSSDF